MSTYQEGTTQDEVLLDETTLATAINYRIGDDLDTFISGEYFEK